MKIFSAILFPVIVFVMLTLPAPGKMTLETKELTLANYDGLGDVWRVQEWNTEIHLTQGSEGNDLVQTTASNQPLFVSSDSNFNNKSVVDFDGATEFMEGMVLNEPDVSYIK